MKNKKVNSITYGAIFCALVGALLLANRLTANYFDMFIFWVVPLPIIVYAVKFGIKQTLIMCVAMLIVGTIINLSSVNFYITTLYFISGILAGIVYGIELLKGKSTIYLIGSVIAVSLIYNAISLFLLPTIFAGYSFTDTIELYTDVINKAKEYMTLYAQMAKDPNLATKAESLIMKLNQIATPAILASAVSLGVVLTCIMEGILVHFLSFFVLKRMKLQTPPMVPISEIKPPLVIKLFVFSSLAAYFLALFMKITQYQNIIMILYAVASIICMFFGYIYVLTVSSLLVKDNKQRKLIITFTIISVFVFPYFLIFMGIIDIFTDRRKRMIEGVIKNAQ